MAGCYDGVVLPAAGGEHFGIGDLEQRLAVTGHGIRSTLLQSAVRR